MKKTIQQIALLITFSILNINAQQDRNVVWVHGLDKGAEVWEKYANYFENERKIKSHRKTYNTNIGINFATKELMNHVSDSLGSPVNNSQNIGIGHSMGGLMLRNSDRALSGSKKNFGGIITVATPNQGADISNSIKNGSVTKVMQNGVSELRRGPANEGIPYIPTNLSNVFLYNSAIQAGIESPITTDDLRPNSKIMRKINERPNEVPIITITAEERSPVHWRFLGTGLTKDDTSLLNTAKFVRGSYNGFTTYNLAMAAIYTIIGCWQPWAFFAAAVHGYRAYKWNRGTNWIDKSETIWKELIKSTFKKRIYYTTTIPEVKCGWWAKWHGCKPQSAGTKTKSYLVTVNKKSDGLLSEDTQKLKENDSGNEYRVLNANHLSVSNMKKTDYTSTTFDVFETIFNRARGDFFRTDKRTRSTDCC
jgi:hypothetical protein